MEHQSENKVCQNCKNDFTIEPADFSFYEKIKVPAPTFCPECRNIQRMATRNSKSLYKRSCDSCNTKVISRFSEDNEASMYCRDCWFGDDWDSLSFGRDYDFSRNFFEQFKELLFSVPHVSLLNSNMINSEYANLEADSKDSYLIFAGLRNENCAFSEYSVNGKYVFDAYWAIKSEYAYACLRIDNCYRIFYSEYCKDSFDTYFSYDCRNCSNIIGCVGLRNKSYCVFNKQYSKKEYEVFKNNLNLGSHIFVQDFIKKSKNFWYSFPHKDKLISYSIDCMGNDIVNSKNSTNVWQVDSLENCKNVYIGAWNKDSYDETSTGGNELSYMCANGGGLYNCIAVLYSFTSGMENQKSTFNCQYSYTVLNSNDCFGCVGVRNKKYCILNKQYEKEEYFEMVEKIKKHMNDMPYVSEISKQIFKYGDFFPPEHSLFAYTETVANDFYPKENKEIIEQGFVFKDEAVNIYNFTDYNIPDNIKDVDESILSHVLKCEETGKGYIITKNELDFYKRMEIPIPRVSPFARIRNRVMSLLPFKIFNRNCKKCNIEIFTSYSPDRPEIVYCEQCYQGEVY
jgi:hypothetical protein